jgi:hypothetical protein
MTRHLSLLSCLSIIFLVQLLLCFDGFHTVRVRYFLLNNSGMSFFTIIANGYGMAQRG